MAVAETTLRTAEEEIEEVAREVLKLVESKGMTPTEAAVEIVTLEQLSDAAILFAVQRHVGKFASSMMNRAFRNARTNGDRHERVDRAVAAMEQTLSFAMDVLEDLDELTELLYQILRQKTGDPSVR